MHLIFELLIALLIIAGGVFSLVGSWGLIKLPEIMARLHAPTKGTTLGVGSFLIASMLYFLLIEDQFSMHELVITIFLFLTAPITASFIAKTHMHFDKRPENLPPTGRPEGWATFDPPGEQTAVAPSPAAPGTMPAERG